MISNIRLTPQSAALKSLIDALPDGERAALLAAFTAAPKTASAPIMVPRAYSIAAAAKATGYSVSTLRREISAGKLSLTHPTGGRPRITDQCLNKWLEGRAVQHKPRPMKLKPAATVASESVVAEHTEKEPTP